LTRNAPAAPINQLQIGQRDDGRFEDEEATQEGLTDGEQESEGWDRWVSRSVKEAPSWLVSTMIHIAIILLLALIPLHREVTRSLDGP
jgi:hypothetical protein